MPSMCLAFALSAATVALPKIALVQIASLSLNPTTAAGGSTVAGTVTLAQTPVSPMNVKLSSSNKAIALTPDSVAVQPGTTSATFIVQTAAPTANTNVEITAQIGASSKAVQLTVTAPAVTGFTFDSSNLENGSPNGAGWNPAGVMGGVRVTAILTISGAAPQGGLPIAINVGDAPVRPMPLGMGHGLIEAGPVTVPAQVVVPAGSSSARFPVITRGVTSSATVEIKASSGGVAKTGTLTLYPADVSSVSINPLSAYGGQSITGTVTMAAPVSSATTIPLQLSGTPNASPGCGSVTVPPSVSVAAGATSATFAITAAAGSYGNLRIYAGGSGVGGRLTDFVINRPAVDPNNSLVFPSSVKGGTPLQAKIQLLGGVSACEGLTFTIKSSNTTLAQIPASVTFQSGAGSATFTITTSAVPNNQTVDISFIGLGGTFKRTLTLTP